MNKKLEAIIKTGKRIAIASLASLAINVASGCASIENYIEPRVGVNIPVAETTQDYPAVPKVGLAYGVNINNAAKTVGIGVEAGLDYSHSTGQYIKTNSLSPRFNVSGNFGGKNFKVSPFVGVNALSEFSQVDIPEWDVHEKISNATLGIELGVGATLFGANARVGYTFMPASQNVKGMVTATIGYRFVFGKK